MENGLSHTNEISVLLEDVRDEWNDELFPIIGKVIAILMVSAMLLVVLGVIGLVLWGISYLSVHLIALASVVSFVVVVGLFLRLILKGGKRK